MKDKQTVPCMYDVFGNEIYEGDTYFVTDSGNILAPLPREDHDLNNGMLRSMVEELGTTYIAEMCGYEKRVCKI